MREYTERRIARLDPIAPDRRVIRLGNAKPKLRANIKFGYYPSGHMIYLNVDALKKLKSDLAAFYSRVAQPGT